MPGTTDDKMPLQTHGIYAGMAPACCIVWYESVPPVESSRWQAIHASMGRHKRREAHREGSGRQKPVPQAWHTQVLLEGQEPAQRQPYPPVGYSIDVAPPQLPAGSSENPCRGSMTSATSHTTRRRMSHHPVHTLPQPESLSTQGSCASQAAQQHCSGQMHARSVKGRRPARAPQCTILCLAEQGPTSTGAVEAIAHL